VEWDDDDAGDKVSDGQEHEEEVDGPVEEGVLLDNEDEEGVADDGDAKYNQVQDDVAPTWFVVLIALSWVVVSSIVPIVSVVEIPSVVFPSVRHHTVTHFSIR